MTTSQPDRSSRSLHSAVWALCPIALALATACGEKNGPRPTENSPALQTYELKTDLPGCNGSRTGQVYYVVAEQRFYYCDGQELRPLDLSGNPGADGAQGPPGEPGQDGQDGVDGSSCHVRDNGNGTSTIYCDDGSESLIGSACGDGKTSLGETCDDGNVLAGDGCSETCQVECGYACAGAPSACSVACGDGLIFGAEQCDDGNAVSGDGCSQSCQFEDPFSCVGEPSQCIPPCGDDSPDDCYPVIACAQVRCLFILCAQGTHVEVPPHQCCPLCVEDYVCGN